MRSKKHITVQKGDIFYEPQEQFLELKFNSAAKNKFKVLDLEAFWAKYLPVYHLIFVSHRQFSVSQGVRRIRIRYITISKINSFNCFFK